jgi:hypothetical protein
MLDHYFSEFLDLLLLLVLDKYVIEVAIDEHLRIIQVRIICLKFRGF